MAFRRDERAVTVQIGAVLLLAIVFAALALYQLNAVPAENERVEFTHNQAVHDELQELRNAIQNVGSDGGTESTAVTLGTQYPSRTVAANPPAPTGRLETTGTATISIDARFAGDESDYEGNPRNLTGDHETTTLAYTPDYREYGSAPTTRIEHGFAFNDFGDAQVSLTDQPLLSDGTIRLVVLEGELSRSGSGAVTLDPTALSGPSDEIPIERQSEDETITITLPTNAPTAWNDTIGTRFNDGESDARVTGYDATDEEGGSLTIELAEAEYDLQVTRVGISDRAAADGEYDVHRTSADESRGTGPAYGVSWRDPSGQSGVVDEKCTAFSCVVVGGVNVDLTMATDGTAADAAVEYAVSDPDIGEVSSNEGRTDANGTHTTTFEASSNAEDGDTVTVYASSGSDGDRITLQISTAPHFEVSVSDTNEPVEEGRTLTVDAAVENLGVDAGEQTIAFALEDEDGTVMTTDERTISVDGGGQETHTFEWNTTNGDAGEYTAVVRSDDATDSEGGLRVVEDRAVLELESVAGLEGGRPDEYEAAVTVSETAGVETDGLGARIVVTDETGARVSDERVAADTEVAGESATITGDIGTLEAGSYEYTVTVDAANAQTVEAVGSFTVEKRTVTIVGRDSAFGNNNEIDVAFTVETGDGSEYQFEYVINEQGNEWRDLDATIDGGAYELSPSAADRISENERVDLLNPDNYDVGDGSVLLDIRNEIGSDARISWDSDRDSFTVEFADR